MGDGQYERLPDLAAELVRLKVDVIVSFVTQASPDAKKATATIPIVIVGVADAVGAGIVDSLAHPGSNVTGTSSIAADLVGKQFEVLKEVIPNTSPTRRRHDRGKWGELFTANICPTKIAEVAVLRHDADCGRERGRLTGDIPWAQSLPV